MENQNNIPNSAATGMPKNGMPMNGAPNAAAQNVPFRNAVVPVTSMVPVSQPYDVPKEKKRATVGYRIFALLFALLSVGGLFLGLIGKVLPVLGHVDGLNQSSISALSGSLLGYLIDFFKNIVDIFKLLIGEFSLANIVGFIGNLYGIFLVFFLCLSVVLSLIMGIVGVASGKASKACMHGNGALLLIAYGGLSLYLFIQNSLLLGVLDSIDFPTMIVAGLALVMLFITTLAERKAGGLLNILFTILSLGTLVLFFFPKSNFAGFSIGVLLSGFSKATLFPMIAVTVTVALFALNFYISCSRVCAKRGYAGDAVRFGLQMVAIILTLVSAMVGANKYPLFKGGTLPLLFTILPLIFIFMAFVFAILAAILAAHKKKHREEAPVQNAQMPPYGYRPMPNGQPMPNGDYRRPIPPPAGANMPPRAIPQNAGANANGDYRRPVPPPNGYPQRPMGPASPIPPMGARPNGPMPPLRPTVPPNSMPPQGKPMTDFERRMAAIAKGEQPAGAPMPQSYPAPPQQQYKPAPQRQIPTAIPASEKVENSVYNPSKYAYDPFVYTLTASEMNEFGDLFIANKFGLQAYLPPYNIGGDNRDFFNKVFIYLGRFRSNISDALLDKLYRYVCGMQ